MNICHWTMKHEYLSEQNRTEQYFIISNQKTYEITE
jgi:hypothetical protein